jgi:hypothetical protein
MNEDLKNKILAQADWIMDARGRDLCHIKLLIYAHDYLEKKIADAEAEGVYLQQMMNTIKKMLDRTLEE